MITSLLAWTAMQQDTGFIEKLSDHLVEFEMVRVPDSASQSIEGLWAMKTEVTFDLLEIWFLRMDLTEEEEVAGVDAESRPSKPYGAIFIGHSMKGTPAICVTHESATLFAQWLSAKTGRHYRLPSVSEWEYIARAGATEDPGPIEDYAWVWSNGDDSIQKVGKLKPNAWGIHDCLGNVAEWAESSDGPVACGGSFRDKEVSFSMREAQIPAWTEADPQNPKSRWWLSNGQHVGFRLVCSQK
ncbi:MAG: formylglycine-generating enzyme family protein [Fimbriimonadaceae bacterium]